MKTKKKTYPRRTHEIPVTKKMLYGVRDELKSEISAMEHRMSARFSSIDARFSTYDARFSSHDARFDKIEAAIHRVAILVEEQNAKNNFVLDGLSSLFERQQRLEDKFAR